MIEPNGQSISIFARNASGKTTIADALSWNLFGKSDSGQSAQAFDWKPRDKDGNEIHHLDTTVTAVFEMEDGDRLTLSKTTKENWVKKHGQKDQEFSGHTTTYEIDGVSKTQGDYDRYISDICDEKRFRALTNVRYVNEQIKWDERRKLLLSLFGGISDADVIASDPALKPLTAILGKRSVDDHKATLIRDRKATNNELKEIRPRIDEQNRTINEADEEPKEVGPTLLNLDKLRADLTAAQERKAQVSSGGEVAELLVELRTLESQAMQISNDLQKAANAESLEAQKIVRQAQFVLEDEQRQAKALWYEIEHEDAYALNRMTEKRAELLAEFGKVNAKTLDLSRAVADACPACGQSLPADLVEAAKQKATEDFNEKKAKMLEAIRAEGVALKAQREVQEKETAEKRVRLEALDALIEEHAKQHDDAQAKAAVLASQVECDWHLSPAFIENGLKQKDLKAKIESMREGTSDALTAVNDQIEAITADIEKAEAQNALALARTKAADRIKELEAEEKRLAGEVERMEQELYLCELFIRAKCERLTEHINKQFALTKWRLFETQINGAIAECCEATIDGRGYSSALSNSERIRVGLDIIDTLGKAYKFWPPCVVDNAESIHDMPETVAQQIRLIVSPPDKKLRIVLDEKKAQEALLG